VVPVAGGAPAHLHAKVTQIEPATAVAVPDGMVLAEAKNIDGPKVPPAPVSATDSLKSLTTAIPLAPIEIRPIAAADAGPTEPIAATAATVAPVIVEAVPEPGNVNEAPVVELPSAAAPEPAVSETTTGNTEPSAELVVAPEPPAVPEPEPVVDGTTLAPEPTPLSAAPEPAEEMVPPVSEPLAMPSSRPGVAWSGSIKGREASAFERVTEVAAAAAQGERGASVSSAGLDVSLLESLADELEVDEPALPIADLNEMARVTESNANPPVDTQALEPVSAGLAEPEVIAEPSAPSPDVAAEPATKNLEASPAPELPLPPPAPPHQLDEDAAMRAIEGGWSRRQTRAMSDAYELTDVSAAVSAAQVAVEQVLAAKGIDASEQGARAQASFGKPKGMPHPRNHQRDNLKQINGLGPLDESSLNNLGIYHFDQIAAWDQKEVLWLENHAFARGRIGREDWQGQARSLMIDSEAARRIGG
jgi:NADH-quinone oxidoreductase subunit E